MDRAENIACLMVRQWRRSLQIGLFYVVIVFKQLSYKYI